MKKDPIAKGNYINEITQNIVWRDIYVHREWQIHSHNIANFVEAPKYQRTVLLSQLNKHEGLIYSLDSALIDFSKLKKYKKKLPV